MPFNPQAIHPLQTGSQHAQLSMARVVHVGSFWQGPCAQLVTRADLVKPGRWLQAYVACPTAE